MALRAVGVECLSACLSERRERWDCDVDPGRGTASAKKLGGQEAETADDRGNDQELWKLLR
jgi:hypothetical protein